MLTTAKPAQQSGVPLMLTTAKPAQQSSVPLMLTTAKPAQRSGVPLRSWTNWLYLTPDVLQNALCLAACVCSLTGLLPRDGWRYMSSPYAIVPVDCSCQRICQSWGGTFWLVPTLIIITPSLYWPPLCIDLIYLCIIICWWETTSSFHSRAPVALLGNTTRWDGCPQEGCSFLIPKLPKEDWIKFN